MLQFFKCIITDQVCDNGAVWKQQPPEDAPKSQEDYRSRDQIFYETGEANFSLSELGIASFFCAYNQ